MRQLPLVLAIFFLVTSIASCGPNGELATNVVTDAEFESVKKMRTNEYTLISNADLKKLQDDAALGKSVGRYQIYRAGVRTWRLDTATGVTCLLLTTDADWNKPSIQAQACNQ